jgi:3-hydroxyacyl-[acyl-carrier-protein] dehydratase
MINATEIGAVSRPSPLATAVRLSARRPDGVTATFRVDADEPVLAGHFPGFPIFPGVCLVECAHQTALLALPPGATLAAIESVRFRSPVLPGDEVTVSLTVAGWTCTATLTVRRGGDGSDEEAALVRLRYREEGSVDGHR